jgi:hypothetical protein
LIVGDAEAVVADRRGRYDRCRRALTRAAGSTPSLVVETTREWAGPPRRSDREARPGELRKSGPSKLAVDAARIVMAHVARVDGHDRPRGAGFGSLVHAVLARVPFEADRSAIAALSTVEARILGLEDDDAAAASSVVGRVLAHDVGVRARAAESRGACRRETPVTYMLPDGTLLEGIVDKTDREVATLGEEQYRRQVALYASAIARATGAQCDGIVLVI